MRPMATNKRPLNHAGARQVLGSGWAELEALLKIDSPRPADLSQIREAHDRYISAVSDRALLRRPPAQP
jgi:hypothetical protein